MRITLPPSLDRQRHTLDEEVAWARSLTLEQRLEAVASACRSAAALLAMNPRREQVLALREPVPESTRELFRRLRSQ
jgi:hypothetical protein